MSPLNALYVAAAAGFHTSQSCGADGLYQHVSKFKTLQELQAFERAWLDAMVSVRYVASATPESAEPVAWRVNWIASATNEPKCCYRTNQDAAELVIEELAEAVPPMPSTLTALFDRPTPAEQARP